MVTDGQNTVCYEIVKKKYMLVCDNFTFADKWVSLGYVLSITRLK